MSASQASLPLRGTKTLPTTQLIHGDCLDVMPTLAENSVAMIFADLPYGGKHRKTTDCHWDAQVDVAVMWPQIWRICCGAAVFSATQPFASLLVASQINKFRYDLIWRKTNVGGWFNANKAPLRAHEHLLMFSAKPNVYNPQKTSGRPYKAGKRPHAKAFADRNLSGSTQRLPTNYKSGSRFPISVQTFNRCSSAIVHPTQKPVALLEWLIRTYTNEGDTVFDPVFGSCTTGVACLRTGRHFIGIEKDADYFRIGSERVAAERARLEAEG